MTAIHRQQKVQGPSQSPIVCPHAILCAWTAMEALCPAIFSKEKDLVTRENSQIASLEEQFMPWHIKTKKKKSDDLVFYHVVLGTICMTKTTDALKKVYADQRFNQDGAKGQAILATILVREDGTLVSEDTMGLSSFGWSVPVALAGNLKKLSEWPTIEQGLRQDLWRKFPSSEPIKAEHIWGAYEWLIKTLEIPEEFARPPYFAVRIVLPAKFSPPSEPLLLNSFLMDDLNRANELAENGKLPESLQWYLGLKKPETRFNLMTDPQALTDALQPKHFPLGSWPSRGRHPLALLQQCAVNLVNKDLQTAPSGVLAVNGPPGTGKTTLLRDVIASILTQRAQALCAYDDPEKAFTDSGQKIEKGKATLTLFEMAEDIRGYEMIVASSNNKAVENVSLELPGAHAIAEDSPLAYFQTVATSMMKRPAWGAISVPLGNAANRGAFRQGFWWHMENGMQRYLQQASGNPQLIHENKGEELVERVPLVIQQENPPANPKEAKENWLRAKTKFEQAVQAVQAALATLQEAHVLQEKLREKKELIQTTQQDLTRAQCRENLAKEDKEKAQTFRDEHTQLLSAMTAHHDRVAQKRPGFFARLFRSRSYWLWEENVQEALVTMKEATQTWRKVANAWQDQETSYQAAAHSVAVVESVLKDLEKDCHYLQMRYDKIAADHPGVFVSAALFVWPHRERQMAAPWLDGSTAALRHAVFEAAMVVHKAFISAAARPIRHNMNMLMDEFGIKSLGNEKRDALIPHLWSTLFLMVPVVSTTFASVSRMFAQIPPESFGWLLIDEAGQALPQAAVGAVMRTKKAVVVGDPMQIEPVITLPPVLTHAICQTFGVNAMVYNPPNASAQTLCDRATGYFGTFESKNGTREVGVPLLVHRRCAEPMFSIANSIAYDNMMVQAKAPSHAPITDILGASCWIDIQGGGLDKWSVAEGRKVVQMLWALRNARYPFNLYIVTPFAAVQDHLRTMVVNSRVLDEWVEDKPWTWARERIGTVHTVQGREAEAVIFVLGAPSFDEQGARHWAGSQPNLLNVAVTRAQGALYVIGNRSLWRTAGHFDALYRMLPKRESLKT